MIDLFQMAPSFDDPLGMLRACHRRIERSLAVIEQIARREQEGVLDEPTRGALRQTLHYFAVGVPRHAADEEESLFLRVGAALPDGDRSAAHSMERLAHEHAAADEAYQALDALGQKLLETGRFDQPEERARFQELITTLQQLYHEHIQAEDEELLPLAAGLIDDPQREAIGREMAARRGIDWEQHLSDWASIIAAAVSAACRTPASVGSSTRTPCCASSKPQTPPATPERRRTGRRRP